ncbi:MAG: deoxyguanosinetriphosphate triphosphohydrolase [Clostridiales bacterium]|jgi:dGTPase|nr:deoxyguanosinetriphosphate triphosphohydrolase [Eubacteriales bacterium]MDH7566964.1 deoxyguanosinetriphosphate triphosphohydrolase [Clostridiales bacterium]
MKWDKLLSSERLGGKITNQYSDQYPISEFEMDYQRIITSASFRRLQDKTQVFPLDKSDFVRTRLTHSIETASLAKQLGVMITQNIRKYKAKDPHIITNEQAMQIADILMCAGLLHDIGNPPFGHFGEVVIRDWFKNNLNLNHYKTNTLDRVLTDRMKKDLLNYEGNAQALRILTKLHHIDSDYGMDLTAAVLNTLIKYPTDSLNIDEDNENIKRHKLGYYLAEEDLLRQIATHTGTIQEDGSFCRHPLTFILEAADDIAYSTADLEDAYKKGMFSVNEFIEYYNKELDNYIQNQKITNEQKSKSKLLIKELISLKEKCGSSSNAELVAFQKWVIYTRDWLLYSAAFGFTTNYSSIMEGTYKKDIFVNTFHEFSLKILKKAMGRYVFSAPSILKLELAAQTIITSLLNKFIPAVIYFNEKGDQINKEFKQTKADKKLTDLISDNYKEGYLKIKTEDYNYNLYLRLLLVTDYISGMTDSYAKNLYQELNGIY